MRAGEDQGLASPEAVRVGAGSKPCVLVYYRSLTTMDLAQLVDFEIQHERDAGGDAGEARVRQRDREIGRRLLAQLGVGSLEARQRVAADRGFRQALCAGWLDALRRSGAELPGERVARAFEVAGWLLAAAGALAGAGAASALLRYDGTTPVNVLYFVGFFFGLQLLLLAALVVFLVRRPRAGAAPGVAHRLVARLARTRLVEWLLGDRGHRTARVVDELRARRGLYASVERWLLFSLAQRFGVVFNLAALATCLWLVAFSDLVFAWSTTLDVTAAEAHAVVRGLAFPWSFLGDFATPSFDVVEASRWVRLRDSFQGDRSLEQAMPLAAQWWRFLVVGLVAYGLLPRLAAWAFGRWSMRRALRGARLDHAAFQRLYERLVPAESWRGPAADAVRGEAPVARASAGRERSADLVGPACVITWGRLAASGDAVARLVRARFAVDVEATLAAGSADVDSDRAAVDAARAKRARRAILVLEAGQQPTRDVIDFVKALRTAVGPTAPVQVGLVVERDDGTFADADRDELDTWSSALAALGDPYLWVEAMEPVP